MATEEASTVTTPFGSLAQYASWIAAILGLWVLASPFLLSGSFGSGTPMWSNVVAGLLILVLAAFGAWATRTAGWTEPDSLAEWSGWLAGLAGLWILVSPFVLGGTVGAGTAMWSNVAGGAVAFLLAAYDGYVLFAGE